jgi:signal transduction histidine kinase/CheY-like chemotaxis protein
MGNRVRLSADDSDTSGEMAARTWAFDWASTTLGAPGQWPESLKTVVGIVLASNHPMFVWWGPDLIQFYNDAYRRTMGPERHPSALGQPGRSCWEEIWPIIGPQIESVMQGGSATWHEDQLVPVTRHGRREDVWWTYGYSAIPDGDRIGGVLVICNDMTQTHLHREELLQLNDRLIDEAAQRRYENERQKKMFEQAPGFMCILRGPDHVFEFANRAYLQLVGGRAVLGKSAREAIPEAAGQGFFALLDQVYSTGRAFSANALPIQLQSGPDAVLMQRYLDFIYQPIVEADGLVSGIFVQGVDTTERKVAEDELLQADRRKDEFLAMLAHELRNPLAPISSAAQVLQLAAHDEARVQMASIIIARQVQHMVGLVDDLLDVSRVSRGEVSINRQPVDTRTLLAAAIEQARPMIEARQHRFELQQPRESPLILGDRKRLVQVVVNLLNNAAKYTQPGGEVVLRVEADADSVRLIVRDNGIGIEPRLIPRIFELFTQATRSPDRAQGGLGIGLSLVKRIVELHGGSVSAHSDGPHTGARFSVSLPRYLEAAHEPCPVERLTRRSEARALRVLIVDDNRDAAETLALCLRTAGHFVDIETDPMHVLTRMPFENVDAYLLDIGLPNIDGHELASRIRAATPGKRAMLVAITGYGQDSHRELAAIAGFDHYFVKPIDEKALIDLLAAADGSAPLPA